MVQESFEWWCSNSGWIIPLLHIKETSDDKITTKMIGKIIKKIEQVGILEYYLKHEGTNKDYDYLAMMLNRKFERV